MVFPVLFANRILLIDPNLNPTAQTANRSSWRRLGDSAINNMEKLIRGAVLQSEAEFVVSLRQVIGLAHKGLNEFKETVATLKAIFKAKDLDSKPKFMGLVILKELTCKKLFSPMICMTYFADKIAKRMKDFALSGKSLPESIRGQTCLDEFKKNSDRTWAQKFYKLNLGGVN